MTKSEKVTPTLKALERAAMLWYRSNIWAHLPNVRVLPHPEIESQYLTKLFIECARHAAASKKRRKK